MCSGSEASSYVRLIDSCITRLKAQGPSRTCNESKEEVKKNCVQVVAQALDRTMVFSRAGDLVIYALGSPPSSLLLYSLYRS